MNLQSPAKEYNQRQEFERNRTLEAHDRENLKRGRDIEVASGKVILTSADGTRYYLVVSNAGALSTSAV